MLGAQLDIVYQKHARFDAQNRWLDVSIGLEQCDWAGKEIEELCSKLIKVRSIRLLAPPH